MPDQCAVLDWAASGAMALTGLPGGPTAASPAAALALLREVTGRLAEVTRAAGQEVRADPAELLTGRAALAGLTRGGPVSAGGASVLLRAVDGWCAVTLSRADDLAAVPAVIGVLGLEMAGPDGAGPDSLTAARGALAAAALVRPAADLAAAAQLLGVPAAALPARLPGTPLGPTSASDCGSGPIADGGWAPWRAARLAPPLPGARLAGAVVADLSSMWAGPLCARLLGLAGADVIKVESPARPDGARSGNREFYDWLHAGHRSLAADITTRAGWAALAALLEAADVVIEASRPRALAAAGLAPDLIPHRAGQVWLSITGYGQAEPDRVAFGDDAAVAGGLVGWLPGGAEGRADGGAEGSAARPVFCADAAADPLAGVCGALAVALSRAGGGGEHIDLSMRDVAAAFTAAAVPEHGPHPVRADGTVTCPRWHRAQAVLPPRRPVLIGGPATPAAALGADTGAVLAWLAGRPGC